MQANETTADYRAVLERIENATYKPRTDIRELNTAPLPGFYVSAIDGGRKLLAEGPFPTHQEALVAVRGVTDAWERVDPRACWYAWGTARVR